MFITKEHLKMKAIQISAFGDADALVYQEIETPTPKPNEALVKITAIGINYIDVYHRTGRYPGKPPFVPGSEAAGVVEAVGAEVTTCKPGDRVAYAMVLGSYAEYVAVPADKLVPVPEGIDDRSAAAAMLQGMTAHYLAKTTYQVKAGDTALVHAGAGGVGLLLTQIIKKLGGKVISTVSTEEKAALSREAGADEVILYTQTDFEEEVKRLTNGEGVDVVYDSVAKTTFEKSLRSLKRLGYMVLYGASSGAVENIPVSLLQAKSLFVTRPGLADYTRGREVLLWRAGEILTWIANGELKLRIEHVYPLAEAPQAHRDLEGRVTTGKLLLIP
jgi:NADPH:quinone reductase